MSMSDYIEYIKSEFASGKTYVELQSDKPFYFRELLRKAVRRRGLLWEFATTDKSVFVIL